MLFILAVALTAGIFHVATAQQTDQSYLHNRNLMERMPQVGLGNPVMLGNLTVSSAGTVGDVYLTTDYRTTNFWLYDGDRVVQGFSTRLDLQRNEFDILMDKGAIKALSGAKVRSFTAADTLMSVPQYFINGQEYKDENGAPFLGFFQILSEGELTLLKMTRVVFKPADQHLSHSTGSKDNRFIKKVDLYYGSGTNALELPNRKGILRLMESHRSEVEKFAKINAINFSSERHLAALFDYYNSLTKK